jgi:hypothetical protein
VKFCRAIRIKSECPTMPEEVIMGTLENLRKQARIRTVVNRRKQPKTRASK